MGADRKPHIGEYDTKTNGVCGFSQIPINPEFGRKRPPAGTNGCGRLYCPLLTST